jgi:hypothetical protein
MRASISKNLSYFGGGPWLIPRDYNIQTIYKILIKYP